jgi:hypothetical protein
MCPLFLTTRHNHNLGALVVTGTVALSEVTPWIDWVTTSASATFTTTVWVIDRVHDNATNRWANTHPALDTGLAQAAQAVLFVCHLANGGAAFDMDLADFA